MAGILCIGSTKRGYLTLKSLLERGEQVIGIISLQQHPHEVERYEESIATLAQTHNIQVYETKLMKDRDYVRLISNLQPDLALVVGCRILIPPEIYCIPRLGTLAVHDSLLPDYRGFAPLNWSILNGEDHVGVSLFYLNENMDGGDIVAQKRVPIDSHDLAPEVYNLVCDATTELILESLPLIKQGHAPRIKQNYNLGSFTCSRTPNDGYIDWYRPTSSIYNQIRALTYPYPGAFTFYKGRKLIVWKAKPHPNQPCYVGRIPGKVIRIEKSDGCVDVLTLDGILRIFEVQFEQGNRVIASEVINSVRDILGVQVIDLVERIQSLEIQVLNLSKAFKDVCS